MIERERRFLVAELPEALPEPSRIVQAYIATGPVSVRIRRENERCTLTLKSGSGRARLEIERALDDDEFDALWPNAKALRIDKRRHRIALDDSLVAELDLFDGELDGRRLVEVEFDTDAEADQFVAPPWFGREVTDDKRYTNSSLARNGWPDPA